MPFNSLLKRASSFLGFSGEDQLDINYEDGDIVYSKNNVCVHTPSQYRDKSLNFHHPGYMVVKCISVTSDYKSLNLAWIPNERLKRNHDLIYNEGRNNGDESSRMSFNSEQDSDTLSISSMIVSSINKPIEEEKGIPQEIERKDSIQPSTSPNEKLSEKNEGESDSGVATKSSSSLTVMTISDGSNQCSPDGDHCSDESRFCKSISDDESNLGIMCPSENSSKDLSPPAIVSENQEQSLQPFHINPEPESLSKEKILADPEEDRYSVVEEVPPSSLDYYVSSSSDSRSESEKPLDDTEALTDYYPVEANKSDEDEISLDSSTDLQSSPPPRYFSSKGREQWYDRSAESMALSANLTFPESPSVLSSLCPTPVERGSSPIRRKPKCSIFSVDLGHMKSLRLFFSNKDKTCGQLVIVSPESQYKILHFHHGGLDKLAAVFEDWNFLITPKCSDMADSPTDTILRQFSVCRPIVMDCELHPDEGSYEYLDAETWITYFSEEGIIEDDLSLRRAIFFGGVEPQLRTNVWPFLLHYYDFRTTFLERQAIMEENHLFYSKINSDRESMNGEEKERFWKAIQFTVEKDVVRTDRSKPCFAGDNNPNLEKMKNILLNFAYYNPHIGYTQGMSDILAPILAEVRNEADVFWCFTGMMSKTIFVTSPRDKDMEKNLNYLGELLKIMIPSFYDYVKMQDGGLDLLFCHRWILLCFKREFNENEVLTMWEACWSNYQTDYFHLFLVVAILAIYGTEVSHQYMRPDEMLVYFTSLANHMDGSLVLKKARGLLHNFRSIDRIPCTLVGLCELCGPGMWDSGHAPNVVCTGHVDEPMPCQVAQSASPNCTVKEDYPI